MRIALGISYLGTAYDGWQSQPNGRTVQDHLQRALGQFMASAAPQVLCAGRTDAGVHGLMQVAHFDTAIERTDASWVRGTNRYLPTDVAVQWARHVPAAFHARACAVSRRYSYVVLESAVRPSIDAHRVGWVFKPLDLSAMQTAAQCLAGEHDFSSFRAAQCQALSPVKTLQPIAISRHGAYWRFDFEGSAFLHHMIRNIMGCLIAVGQGTRPPGWMREVLAARSRAVAAPTFSADGLYFLGPRYAPQWDLPDAVASFDWLPH
ncbi:MAG: tRNA pseudouridine(38-40) synthase TruA [Burkholderiaceae bacterium]|nr:tRNA pseudouridine(38-40) synthase TruA [Burkholderiaceae bacterium]MDP3424993.1 tRNA pseudouridine(38-40) synthase TruA [Burkholderiaceae bacterium]